MRRAPSIGAPLQTACRDEWLARIEGKIDVLMHQMTALLDAVQDEDEDAEPVTSLDDYGTRFIERDSNQPL